MSKVSFVDRASLIAVMAKLNAEVMGIKKRTMGGLIDAAMIVRREMDTTPPLIPVDTNELRLSWDVIPAPHPIRPSITLGFFADYAFYVHEMLNASFQRPGAGPKFFEAALNRKGPDMLEAIRKRAKV